MNSTPDAYCFNCKKITSGVDGQIKTNVRNRQYMLSKCKDCGCKKCRMIKGEKKTTVTAKKPKASKKLKKLKTTPKDPDTTTPPPPKTTTYSDATARPEIVIN